MAHERKAGGQSPLWLGARVAEVEALFALALDAPTPAAERAALRELAAAAERLAAQARHVAAGHPLEHRPAVRVAPRSARARRRTAIALRGTDRIIAWTARAA